MGMPTKLANAELNELVYVDQGGNAGSPLDDRRPSSAQRSLVEVIAHGRGPLRYFFNV